MSCAVAAIVVPLNIIFGIAAAWAITKFRFRGRAAAADADRPAILDLAGHCRPGLRAALRPRGRCRGLGNERDLAGSDFVHLAGIFRPLVAVRLRQYLYRHHLHADLAIVLATSFVTFPFVARSLIPLMDAQGSDEELAALSLGASGWRTFWTVTLPNIRWGLLYGAILCTARAFGEFGAVSVVSGHIDSNDTIPLRVEKLWDGYNMQAAFAVSTLLALLAVVTLVIKAAVEIRTKHTEAAATAAHEVKPDEYRSTPDQQDLRLVSSAEGRKP